MKSEEIDKKGGSVLRLVLPSSSDFGAVLPTRAFEPHVTCSVFSINILTSGNYIR